MDVSLSNACTSGALQSGPPLAALLSCDLSICLLLCFSWIPLFDGSLPFQLNERQPSAALHWSLFYALNNDPTSSRGNEGDYFADVLG